MKYEIISNEFPVEKELTSYWDSFGIVIQLETLSDVGFKNGAGEEMNDWNDRNISNRRFL